MINNWISLEEILYILRKAIQEPERIQTLLSRLLLNDPDKVRATWAITELPPIHWFLLPAVMKRINFKVTGDASIHYSQYFLEKYFSQNTTLKGLSLGCGTGANELLWMKTNRFSVLDAYDISESRIEYANRIADQNGFKNKLNYMVGDVNQYNLPEQTYDLVLCIQSLHHFSPLEKVVTNVQKALKPGGYFLIDEFVGPTRFQWTKRQVEIINSLIHILPAVYKKAWKSNFPKLPLVRPSQLSMILRDPSEAVESSKILPVLEKAFDPLELRGYGGTILHPLLYNIAQNFTENDETGNKYLQMCFKIEDLSIESKELSHDFVVGVYRKS